MFIRYSLFDKYKLKAFTTTVKGGVSCGNYSSFNLSEFSNDNTKSVVENREVLVQQLNIFPDKLFAPYQTHEDKIKVIDAAFLSLAPSHKKDQLIGYDALITNQKDICIGITTADCVPLLIYDPTNHVLGAVHAGWKGTVKRIGAKTIIKMQEVFESRTEDLLVAIGPSISPQMFEVGDEVGEVFKDEGFNLRSISFRSQETEKLHIDLWQANIQPLLNLGVQKENIELSGICTFQNQNFFSARRQTINSGRMLTGGVLK